MIKIALIRKGNRVGKVKSAQAILTVLVCLCVLRVASGMHAHDACLAIEGRGELDLTTSYVRITRNA